MSTDGVHYEVDDGVAQVTIDRPHHHNAVDAQMRRALHAAFEDFHANDAASVLIVTAVGEKMFCAGGDLKEMTNEPGLSSSFSDCLHPLRSTDKPTIAAVNGAAFGGGFLLAQVCDLCLASEQATFAITEARWGRGAPWALPLFEMIPRRIALELLFTGAPITASRALDLGLVNAVVSAGELARAARALAETIRDNAPLSVRGHKAISRLVSPDLEDAVTEAWRLFEPIYASHDAQEGPRAFREKRAPQWKGR